MKYIFTILLTYCFSSMYAQDAILNYAENDTINDNAVIDFGKKLQASFYEKETTFFLDNFDKDGFASKIVLTDEEIANSKDLKAFNGSFKKGFFSKFDAFPTKIIESMENDNSYDIVNFYYSEDEKKYHLLFRMFSDEEGLNYHDYQLNYVNNKFLIEDLYIYTTGEYLSDTLRQLYLMAIPKNYMEDINMSKEQISNMVFIFGYKNLVAKKEYKKALDLLNNLKGDIRNQKIFYILKIQVASEINEVYYMEAIDELLKKFPDDPSTQLMAVDYYVMLKDYNATMGALNQLQEVTEDDFVEYVKGNMAWEFEDYEGAEKAYTYIMNEYPNYQMAKINLLYLYDFLEKHEDNILLLNKIINSEEFSKQELIDFIDDKENEFINLPNAAIYTKWKEKK
ncbi:hypothetical protein IMCC3317_00800 [Kordia antarctica]|uniref:Beta-barrel assembly-enhancing protease n=1 Tax=Kordia antarctica TaxID=1218801 RepID=A0A7L4ZET2_9FLAO|nr:hypothetical protein [Kordia antarctica]QHI34736.1 hypothetical protein IMCC3317_00800 [Kordia antarctica]